MLNYAMNFLKIFFTPYQQSFMDSPLGSAFCICALLLFPVVIVVQIFRSL